MRFLLLLTLLLVPSFARADIVTSFEDIQFWVGSGSNQSAFVLDWDSNNPGTAAYAWGYRWDGSATSADMFASIIAADARLFAKISNPGAFGVAIYGIGYDNGDGNFALDDNTLFPASGLAVTSPGDGAQALGLGDLYVEGWFADGFWAHHISNGNPYGGGSWESAQTGTSDRQLADGSWDGFAFLPGFAGPPPSIAQAASITAIPEPTSLATFSLLAVGAGLMRRSRSVPKGKHHLFG